MKSIEIPPYAPTLMESTRAIGYSIESAIADIIDNSITAQATHIEINFFPINEAYIAIFDNGIGMSEDELTVAMQYGSKNPLDARDEKDLGRYGLGMKTASLSQCRVLTVITKKNGQYAGAQWNLNHVQNTKKWSLILFTEREWVAYPCFDKLDSYDSGTLVIWQDLDKFKVGVSSVEEAFQKKMDIIRNHLSLVFHRYLAGEIGIKKIEMEMNGVPIIPKDPFLIKKSTQLIDEEIIVVRNEKIRITPYILPHTSKLSQEELKELGGKDGLRKNQGFYIYRNKRLLAWGSWFRLMRQGDLSKLARVQVDIPNSLDDLWTLDIKKSTAIPPEEVKKNLSIIIDRISEGSKRTWTYRGKKETSDNVIHVWNRMITRDGGIIYEINTQHPLIKRFEEKYPEISKDIDNIMSQISHSLPLNSLYIDLTNDEKIQNDSDMASEEVVSLLKSISESVPVESIKGFIDDMKTTEPFCNFITDIEVAEEKGFFYDK